MDQIYPKKKNTKKKYFLGQEITRIKNIKNNHFISFFSALEKLLKHGKTNFDEKTPKIQFNGHGTVPSDHQVTNNISKLQELGQKMH